MPDIVLENGVGENGYLTQYKLFNPWVDFTGTPPTQAEIDAEIVRIKATEITIAQTKAAAKAEKEEAKAAAKAIKDAAAAVTAAAKKAVAKPKEE